MVNSNVVRTWLVACAAAMFFSYLPAVAQDERALWASIAAHPSKKEIISTGDYYQSFLGKVLVTWRMLPDDDATTGFDLYRRIGTGSETKLNSQPTTDVCTIDSVFYPANDISVGDLDGTELMTADGTARAKEKSCNMAIWFDGTLSRQLIDGGIINSYANGRTFTMYRYDESFINGTKSKPGWYGDLLGDWREEVIVPSSDKLTDIKIFSTWYPTEHKLPWLMTDHTYLMSALNENVGYNQPTHTGYYLGSDWTSDADIWAAASAAPGGMDYATYILGDVNGSGSVDIGDAVCIVNLLVGKIASFDEVDK